MPFLVAANILAVLTAAWAVWECRLNFFSRYDSARTITLLLFCVGSVLDSPLRAMAEASQNLVGRYYFFTVVGHLCWLTACVTGNKFVYVRLLPDSVFGRLMRTRVMPALVVVGTVMVMAYFASPRPETLSADYLYLVPPDGWLKIYWFCYFTSLTALLLLAAYGAYLLKRDPRSVKLNLLITALLLGAASSVTSGLGMATDRSAATPLWVWGLADAAIVCGSIAVTLAWRERLKGMIP